MDLLLILTYTAICVVIFKTFRIPLNKWTVPTAVLGGIIIIGTLIFAMNYNHPYSEMSREYFITTPIVPNVSGQVIDVPVSNNTPLNDGDILFKIDPIPFENKLHSLQAQLKVAEEDLQRANQLVVKNAMPIRDRDIAESRRDQLKAEVAIAQYELNQTTVKAPGKGYVTQVSVRPGMRAVSLPLMPLMIFVPEEKKYLIGWFRQNSLLRLQVNDTAEVTFDGIPGVIFKGHIKHIYNVMAEGQVSPTGELITATKSPYPGRIPVKIEITDPSFDAYRTRLPGGSYAQTAIYSQHARHLAVMRKVLLRMAAWLNYIYPFH
jgi:multidrug resistance efflux pump